MSHSLVLFSQRHTCENGTEIKQLYCFIELFGTFQYFVELNDNYIGKNIEPETYAQRIIRRQESESKIQGLRYKEIASVIKELGLDYKDFDGLNYNDICTKVQTLYDKQNKYIYDYKENAKFLIDSMIQNELLSKNHRMTSVMHD